MKNIKLKSIILTIIFFQHLLEGLVEEVYQIQKKQFLYKRGSRGRLVTSVHRLADPAHGASVKSFRKIEEIKSKFPIKFWK